jgi:hypothetical protein
MGVFDTQMVSRKKIHHTPCHQGNQGFGICFLLGVDGCNSWAMGWRGLGWGRSGDARPSSALRYLLPSEHVVGRLYSVQYKSIFGAPNKVRCDTCDKARPLSQV